MSENWNKFWLLFWKNWLLQVRHPVQTFIEILAPVLFSSLLVIIRSLVDSEEFPDGVSYPAFQTNDNSSYFSYTLAWSPENPNLEKIMDDVVLNLGFSKHESFNDSSLMESTMVASTEDTILAGIQFDDSLFGDVALGNNLDIKIRFPGEMRYSSGLSGLGTNVWFTNLLFPVYLYAGPRSLNRTEGGPPSYQEEGFLAVQQEVVLSVINYFKRSKLNESFQRPDIWMQRYPYPRWVNDLLLTALESFVSLIIMLSFNYTCINIVRAVTTEKEKQLKETMKIMGLPGWLHWTAWFVKEFLFLLISVILIVILVKVRWYPETNLSVFTASDPTVIFVLFIPYISSIITFSFLISVFFSRANVAATVAGMGWFLSYAPYMFMRQRYSSLSLAQKLSASIFANTAVAYGFQLMIMFEGNDEGFQWDNVWETASADDNLMLGHILLMLTFDTILYLLVALYVEAVFPGKFGVPQKWYFPFSPSYWCGKSHYIVDTSYELKSEPNEFLEKEPDKLKIGVQIKHLNKVYKNKKVAVRNLSLNMYEDQITVLLGHNGAGKTTTMSMLTGIFPPTTGTAVVAGHDIRTDIKGVRNSLGLCPQHNVLFDELTVRDHLYFFSKLKGMRNNEIEEEINKYLVLLELTDKRNAKSSTLSGGMKRKLCVGMALCGNSKVVMLDEPSAGVDPSARRALWDLLQQQKKGRTLLLTTHFMDEADLLGDRIAIMAGGKLQCCGSSFFLKKKYGAGYHLVVDKSLDCDVSKVTELLQRYLPDVIIENNVGSELTYLLDEERSDIFENMLADLEKNSESLGILSYGISLTTLEEVFMKVGADHGQEEINDKNERNGYNRHEDSNSVTSNGFDRKIDITTGHQQYLQGWALWKNQFLVMFLKRILSTYRSWGLMIIQILIPVLFLIIAIIVARIYDRTGNQPNLEITLDVYENPVTLVSGTNSNNYYQSYVDMINSQNHALVNIGASDLSEKILQETATNTPVFRRRYIVAASFDSPNSTTALFSNIPYHGAPLSLNLVLNSILRRELGPDYSIRVYNHPIPFTIDTRLRQLANGGTMGFQLAFNMGFSMAFVTSFYIMFYIRERVMKAKHLQFVSGVKVIIFWGASFLNDIVTFMVTVIFTLSILVCFQEDGFRTFADYSRLFAAYMYFCWAVLPLTYLASFGFSSAASGFTRLTLINIFTGVAAYLVIEVLYTDGLDLEYIANTLHWIFLLIPHYSFSTAVSKMNNKYSTYSLCNTFVSNCINLGGSDSMCWNVACNFQNQCCNVNENYFEWKDPGIGRNLLFSMVGGAVFIVILLLIEFRVFHSFKYFLKSLFSKPRSYKTELDPNEDYDVAREKDRIRNASPYELQNNAIALRDVTKFYGNFLAVNNICLTVDRHECFGLLGVNGAGKTTTFKMMTGDVMMSSGDAWMNGLSLKEDLINIYKSIGYCPQFDALLDNLTGRETLRMFCMLKGISYSDSNNIAVKLAHDFDFARHLDKQVMEYSGGNKRKLSTAVALIGDPLIIYLDEPSTGMDPATKRQLWNVLSGVREKGKCLVLTSHSMEECEALCTRLAIMVNGTFKCIGSVQHLKSKFSEGYTLIIKMRKTTSDSRVFQSEVNEVKDFVNTNFPGAILREEHQELISYHIKNKSLKWSTMFGIMERGKVTLNIEDYSLGQSNLEQVFLTFTKLQRES